LKPEIKGSEVYSGDTINSLIHKNSKRKKRNIKQTAISVIRYKRILGARLEVKGRLTKRFTAARSLSKSKYKGNLTDIDSSYLGLSSVFLKGNLKSNVQYAKSKGVTRIGSFGLKG